MTQSAKKTDPDPPGKPPTDGQSEDPRSTGLKEVIERAGSAYFEACHRMARSINRLKGRRKKR